MRQVSGMLSYKPCNDEQETLITFYRGDGDASIYTADRQMMKKFDALCAGYPDDYECTWTDTQILGDGLPMAKRYRMPLKLLRFGKPASDAQRSAARNNLNKINSKP